MEKNKLNINGNKDGYWERYYSDGQLMYKEYYIR